MQVLKVSSNENKSVQSHVIPVTWEHWQFSSTRAVISAGLIAFFLTFSNDCGHTSLMRKMVNEKNGCTARVVSKIDQKIFFQLKPDSDRVLSPGPEAVNSVV